MFNVEKSDNSKVIVEIGGHISAREMSDGIDELTELIADMPKAHVMTIYNDIDMPETGALFEEFKRLPQMLGMIGHLERVAVVSDQRWIRDMASLEGLMLPTVDVRGFAHSARAQADAFLDGTIEDIDDDENFPV